MLCFLGLFIFFFLYTLRTIIWKTSKYDPLISIQNPLVIDYTMLLILLYLYKPRHLSLPIQETQQCDSRQHSDTLDPVLLAPSSILLFKKGPLSNTQQGFYHEAATLNPPGDKNPLDENEAGHEISRGPFPFHILKSWLLIGSQTKKANAWSSYSRAFSHTVLNLHWNCSVSTLQVLPLTCSVTALTRTS